MTVRQWLIRIPFAIAITIVTWVVATVMDFRPDIALLTLYVAVGTALFSVAYQSFGDSPVGWEPQETVSMRPLGHDSGTNSAMRMLENHLTTSEPTSLVRDRLARLAEARMRQNHGVGLSDPGAAGLLDDQTLQALRGPVRRLNKNEIDRIVTRIEEL
jgi:hypothetical protein